MFAYTYPLLDVFWTMLYVFCFVLFIWLLIVVISDIFRSHDMGGWAKAAWIVLIIVLPLLGILVYVIARGDKMAEHRARDEEQADQAMRAYVRETTGGIPVADELAKLGDLRDAGVITEAEFQAQKAKILT
jgi:ABC-type multidrug transport system fused ATPase/permease subunit